MRVARICAAALLAVTTFELGCATTSTVSAEVAPDEYSPHTGVVESVRLVVHRVRGNPAGGAAAGALIGAVLFGGRGGRTLFGAAAGAATGAALSQGEYETHAYEVTVRFDNGTRGVFTYRDRTPFRQGDRVDMGPDGPELIAY